MSGTGTEEIDKLLQIKGLRKSAVEPENPEKSDTTTSAKAETTIESIETPQALPPEEKKPTYINFGINDSELKELLKIQQYLQNTGRINGAITRSLVSKASLAFVARTLQGEKPDIVDIAIELKTK